MELMGCLTREQLGIDGGSWSSPLQQNVISNVRTGECTLSADKAGLASSIVRAKSVMEHCDVPVLLLLGSPMENLREGRG